MMINPVGMLDFWKYKQGTGQLKPESKPVVLEHQMDLVVNSQTWLRFICSPTDLEALGIGFLFTENCIKSLADIKKISLSVDGDILAIDLNFQVTKPQAFHRTSTSITIQNHMTPNKVESTSSLKADDYFRLFKEFMALQTYHETAGGFHSACLCDPQKVRYVVEDLGRHNCVDKLAGLYLLNHETFPIQALLLSGRISSEMIAKSLAMQIPVMVSRTSPTALAIQTANTTNVTLIGYLRGNQFDVYSHPERLLF